MLLIMSLAACTTGGPNYEFTGFRLHYFFPLDGQREWTYVNLDPTVPYQVVGELQAEPEVIMENDAPLEIFTITYRTACIGSDETCVDGDYRVSALDLSSTSGKGVRVHGFASPEGGHVTLDPPFLLAGATGKAEDSWSTDTNGTTWTSSFTRILADCPERWTGNFHNCPEFVVDAAGAPISGTWCLATGWGLTGFAFEGENLDEDGNPYVWNLLRSEYTND